VNHRIAVAVGVVVLALASGTASAQGRKTQAVTGASLASLGVYAAVMDRDCAGYPQTTPVAGRCEWRTARGVTAGNPGERSREQLAAGLAVAGIGGLMAGGAWEPSKALDSILTAGAGFILLATAWNEGYVRGTIHVEVPDGRRFTLCEDPRHWSYSWRGRDYNAGVTGCETASFSRLHMMWSGFAALGLAAGRALWRDDPPLSVSVQSGGVWVGKTIAF